MSTSIKKFEQLPPELTRMEDEAGETLRIGDMFFTDRGNTVIRIRKMETQKVWANNTPGDKTQKDVWYVYYDHATNWEATEWSSYGNEKFETFLKEIEKGRYVKITRPLSEVMAEANKVLAGEIPIEVYQDNEYNEGLNNESAIIGRDSKTGLVAIQKAVEEKRKTASLVHAAVTFEMEKRKAELSKMRDKLYGVVAVFQKQIKKIYRVITTIELYLGIDEEIVQIREGVPAPAETPISFRQQVLFMDEEVGIHEEGGIDFKEIEVFDEWLCRGKNVDIVLPEKKGVVVLRPRRHDKRYTEDGFMNIMMNIPNHENTYILIRNGDCLYRIFTEKLVIKNRLFPLRKELQELFTQMQKETWEDNKEKIEDEMYQYKQRAILMQGLIDRTEILHPLPAEKLNIFRLEENQNSVNFIYDDEAALPSGRMSFWDWKTYINEKIGAGSRVLLTGSYEGRSYKYSGKDYADRFYMAKNSYDGLKNVPDLPKEGVFTVEGFTSTNSSHYRETEYNKRIAELTEKGIRFTAEGVVNGRVWSHSGDPVTGSRKVYSIRCYAEKSDLTIMYMPEAEASSGWDDYRGHERKVRTRFKIEQDDNFVLNYDQISLDDVEFYLHSRVDREGYLLMMPLLKKLRTYLHKEMKNEEFFIEFVSGRNPSVPNVRERVIESIGWWKFKNKWKRAINKDDTLALRMIEARIKSSNYEKLKTQS